MCEGFEMKWGVGFDASDFGGLRWLRACTLNVEFEKYPKTYETQSEYNFLDVLKLHVMIFCF